MQGRINDAHFIKMAHRVFQIFKVRPDIAMGRNNDFNRGADRQVTGILLMCRIGDIGVRNHRAPVCKLNLDIGGDIGVGHKFALIKIGLHL